MGSSELEPSNSGRARSHLEVLKDNGEGLWATRAGQFKFRGDVCGGGPGLRASGFGFLSPADQRRTRGRMQCTCASGVGHWWLGFAYTWWAISRFQLQPVGWFGRWVATGEGEGLGQRASDWAPGRCEAVACYQFHAGYRTSSRGGPDGVDVGFDIYWRWKSQVDGGHRAIASKVREDDGATGLSQS